MSDGATLQRVAKSVSLIGIEQKRSKKAIPRALRKFIERKEHAHCPYFPILVLLLAIFFRC